MGNYKISGYEILRKDRYEQKPNEKNKSPEKGAENLIIIQNQFKVRKIIRTEIQHIDRIVWV